MANKTHDSQSESYLQHDIEVVDQAIVSLASLQDILKRLELRRRTHTAAISKAKNQHNRAIDNRQFVTERSYSDVANVVASRRSKWNLIPRISHSEGMTDQLSSAEDNLCTPGNSRLRPVPQKSRSEHDLREKFMRGTSQLGAVQFIAPSSNSNLGPIPRLVLVELFKDDIKHVSDALEAIAKCCSIETVKNNTANNLNELYEIGGHVIVLALMKKHYTSRRIQEGCCASLHYLMVHKRICSSIEKFNLLETIVLAMQNFPNSDRIHQFGCGILNGLTWKNEMNTRALVEDLNGPVHVCSAMLSFPKNIVLQQFGTLLLANMIRWNNFRTAVVVAGGRERLTTVIMDYMDRSRTRKSVVGSTVGTGSNNSKPTIDFESKIYKKARRAVRRLL